MHCVILAAGASTRMLPLTEATPKCLLTVGRQTILERTIREVFHAGIVSFTIVTGFQEWKVRMLAQRTFPSISIDFVNNPEFLATENAVSLLLARETIGDDGFILLDSDIMFDEAIVRSLLGAPGENCAAVRLTNALTDEEIKVVIDAAGNIAKIGKHLAPSEAGGESIGIEKFSPAGASRLFALLERRLAHPEGRREYYEASFQELIDTGTPIRAVDTGSHRCIEIDTPEDLRQAEALFKARK